MVYRITILFFFLLNTLASCQGDRNWDFNRIMKVIGVEKGMILGEAGAGGGFFTFHLASQVGETGKVYANDISSSALSRMKSRALSKKVVNIEQVLGDIDDPKFPIRNLEMIVIVHAFHDFSEPIAWLKNARKYVKKNGKLIIIDKDPDRWGQGWSHFLEKKEVLKILNNAGFDSVRVEDFMTEDNIYIATFN